MNMIVHLRIGVLWNLVTLCIPIQRYLVYPTMNYIVRMAMLGIIGYW
jgi:hypothetical protein